MIFETGVFNVFFFFLGGGGFARVSKVFLWVFYGFKSRYLRPLAPL